MDRIGFDFETHTMGPQKVAPPVVCLSAHDGEDSLLYGRQEAAELEALIESITDLEDLETIRVAHNAAFDLAVLVAHRPDLLPAVFTLLESGLIHCTVVREKLLNLTITGDIDYITRDGQTMKASYDLGSLVFQYFGIKIEGKQGDDAWRTNYAELETTPVAEWPSEAQEYALLDSIYAHDLWDAQEKRRQAFLEETGIDPFAVLDFRVMADFCLFLMTCWGLAVDPEEKEKIEKMLEEALDPKNLQNLIGSGILRPAEPPRPFANGAKNPDGTPKMTKGKDESIDKAKLAAKVEQICKKQEIEVRRTAPSSKFPDGQISVTSEVLDDLMGLDPALDELRNRQKLQKLVTTELPRMNWEGKTSPIVHPSYDVLKRTGRTSSYASKSFPSFNCQNVDPRARGCFRARPGTVLFSVDYSQMELGTLAQQCVNLFGKSVLADKINAGYDLHAYLGAGIAAESEEEFFKKSPSDPDERYVFFTAMAKQGEWDGFSVAGFDSPKSFYKHYRTFAKPTGLGYPGGLGPDTFVTYAKATYGVIIDRDTASHLRDVWLATFPEMEDYFKHINDNLPDPRHDAEVVEDPETGKKRKVTKYAYSTPFGMYRPNADYCAAANGFGLQSPSAEGSILGCVIQTVRASYDPSVGSILGPDEHGATTRPICFVHDEILGEIRNDDPIMRHNRVMEIVRLMVESMREVTPDVTPRANPALMVHWNKAAEAVYDDNGILQIWTPDA